MQHNTLPSDIRPGEELLANRIRNTFPASVRDGILPPADADLVREVRRRFGTCDQNTAYCYVRTTVIACVEEGADWDTQESAFVRQRIETYFKEEHAVFKVRK